MNWQSVVILYKAKLGCKKNETESNISLSNVNISIPFPCFQEKKPGIKSWKVNSEIAPHQIWQENSYWQTLRCLLFPECRIRIPGSPGCRESYYSPAGNLICNSLKCKKPRMRLFSGGKGIRTPDPLLVRQMLWTSWAMPPYINSFLKTYVFSKGSAKVVVVRNRPNKKEKKATFLLASSLFNSYSTIWSRVLKAIYFSPNRFLVSNWSVGANRSW